MAEVDTLDRVVMMHDKAFEIKPPDALILLRLVKVVSKVGNRAEAAAKDLGLSIFNSVKAKSAKQEDKEGEDAGVVSSDLISKIFVFLSVLNEDDLLRLGSALLQFPDEDYGVKWLRKNGVLLTPLVRAMVLSLEQLQDVIEALQVFTPTLRGLRMLTSAVAQDGSIAGQDSEG